MRTMRRKAGPVVARADEEPPTRGPVEVTIDAVGAQGDGLARWKEHRLYIPQTLQGDRLMAVFGKRRGDGYEGEPVSLLAEGPGRVEPVCSHYGMCGGCSVQHMNADVYAAWKLEIILRPLQRAGLLDEGAVVRPLAVSPPGSRRRAVLAAAKRGSRLWLGFHERQSHRLVDVARCPVLTPRLEGLIAPLRALLAALLSDGQTLDVALCDLHDGVDVLLQGFVPRGVADLEPLAGFATDYDLARLSCQAKPSAPIEPVALRRAGLARFGDAWVSPPPGGFLQATADGEANIVAALLEGLRPTLAARGGEGRVLDLFAGCGSLSFPLLALGKVWALESDAAAIDALAQAARLAGCRVTAERRDLFKDPLSVDELANFDAVVIDPPRAGAAMQIQSLAQSCIPTVMAVSCNPATFARDALVMKQGGYRLTDLWPIDQFLWSAHAELVARFARNEG
jgi:23S rRNA (uracil1939-C5)-methyltransferase